MKVLDKGSSRRVLGLGVIGTLAVVCLAACNPASSTQAAPSSSSAAKPSPSPSATAVPTASPVPATVAISPANGTQNVSPVAPITATATGGKLTAVEMTNDAGVKVAGTLDATGASWKATEPLGYGKTYTITAAAQGDSGAPSTQTSTFTTLKPGNMTKVYLNTTGGQSLNNGATYGVGIVVVAHFDEQVGDEKAAEQALQVTTTPHVDGSWYWVDKQNAHWRPQNYYAPGTQVTVNANVYGVQVGDNLWGETDTSVAFKIGDKHVSIADDATHQVAVYFNDVLQRSMPTSMGRGGSTVVNGKTISFWTQPGTYTVIGQGNPVIMDSSTYGLPVNSKLGYKEPISWATQISTDGVYLHQLNSTVWAQGSRDLSHGCLNLNHDNAMWFYQTAQIGDVVQVVNTGGSPLQIWQNGDWTLDWNTWKAGSAIK